MMKKRASLAFSVVASIMLIAAVAPVTPVFANTPTDQANSLSPEEIREKYVDKMDLKSEDVLGFYYTTMKGSSDARVYNIKKAAKRLNGEMLDPHETFSYNQTVGNSNLADEGWRQAGVIVGGQLVDGYGGGICQVSSTLFNAVTDAKMTVTERHSHSKRVGYVPVGMDATVAYGFMDLQFVNPFDFQVKIKAKVYDGDKVVIAIVRA